MNMMLLNGTWELAADPAPCRYSEPPAAYPLTMTLPGTTARQRIGRENPARETGYLTERYPFAGQIWLRKTVKIAPEVLALPKHLLHFERTRITQVWINGRFAGSENSLCTPHEYDVSGLLAPETEIAVCVRNTGYPVPGGHMTSPDTQTNWIGITGALYLASFSAESLSDLRLFPDAANRTLTVRGVLHGMGTAQADAVLSAVQDGAAEPVRYGAQTVTLRADENGAFSLRLALPETVPLWREYDPALTALTLTLENGESARAEFGLRDFRACGDHFALNGVPVLLRGKHDGMVFPLEGAAPTDSAAWLERFGLLRDWGINHIRFHTCCPPDAAFAAADRLGIYLEPELPFWGTVDAPGGEKYDEAAQEYLIREGLRICRTFGNHPSFVMFSLGNELWGSPERLGEIITVLRRADPRPLYTQGSNNFQHMPLQIPEEDFWTGVRTGKGRLLRGSYATCDAPIGRVQTHAPSADWDYEEYLCPAAQTEAAADGETEIEIQYGTGVKRVRAKKKAAFVPDIPAVTHEIGQYAVYPDFSEIPHYTGVLAARNFEIFRERLEQAGMGHQAADFFRCSGQLARDCYQAELEAAMRSPHLAGFQILDLQDFPGQGTALVGMLNALCENKGLIAPERWRAFCGDLVPLARFDSFVLQSGGEFICKPALRISRPSVPAQPYVLTLHCGARCIGKAEGEIPETTPGYLPLPQVRFALPDGLTGHAVLRFALPESGLVNTWELTVLPPAEPLRLPEGAAVAHSRDEAEALLRSGKRVLLLETPQESIPGFYCTDFWCYPMFRSISESMGKAVPVGTMGLCIDRTHPAARALFSSDYTTPQWYQPVTHADCAVLDGRDDCRIIVQMIDNFERNHRLALVYEEETAAGRLLVCTVRFDEKPDDPAMAALLQGLADSLA